VDRERARELRRKMTDAERRLWARLRDRRLGGHKFRRQEPIGPYVVDFVCAEAGLVVEVDGSQHAEREEYDAARTRYLEERGHRVLRFWDNDALTKTDAVLQAILDALSGCPPSPRPSPPVGGEGNGDGAGSADD